MAQIKPDFYQLKYLDFPFRQNVETALGLQKAVFYEREGDTGNIASQADVLLARHASESLRKSTVARKATGNKALYGQKYNLYQ